MDKGQKILLDAFRHHIEYLMPSEIAEKHRVLSAGKYKGQFQFKRSPFFREIVDTISPENTQRVFGVEKGSQIGWTIAALANLMLAVFKQYGADMMFMSDTDEQVKRAMNGFIDDMIRESGLGDTVGKKGDRSRKKPGTGDTVKEKKFGDNHTLFTWSGQTVGKLSSISPKFSFNDECERYKFSDKQGGNPYALILNRHKTFSGEYKAYFGSTPELIQTSVIHPIFLQGDQRYYHIPCPHCGSHISLQWHVQLEGKDTAGIYYKRTSTGGADPKSVGYICQECGGFFKESHKLAMFSETEYQIRNTGTEWTKGNVYKLKDGNLPLCRWIPTATPLDPDYGSYNISALYSGAGFHTWAAIVKGWCLANPTNAPKNLDMLKTFYNQELGLPWEDRGREVDSTQLRGNTRLYEINHIPSKLIQDDGNGEIVLITCAVDLNGIMGKGDKYEDDDVRLDYEVVAWCSSGNDDFVTSYSLDHGSIGNFERASETRKREEKGDSRKEKWTYRHGFKNNVWDEFEKILYTQYVDDEGRKMGVNMCGVDTGNYTVFANEFVNKHTRCIALKGDREDDYTRFAADAPYFKKGTQKDLYLVANNLIKDKLADQMMLPWQERKGFPQPEGFMNYPRPANNKYGLAFFKEYEGEKREIKKDALGKPLGMRWIKKHSTSPQHFWDCRVYNIAVQKIVTHFYCKGVKGGTDKEVSWQKFCGIVNGMR